MSRCIRQSLCVGHKVDAMDTDAAIKYVGLQSLTTLDYVPWRSGLHHGKGGNANRRCFDQIAI